MFCGLLDVNVISNHLLQLCKCIRKRLFCFKYYQCVITSFIVRPVFARTVVTRCICEIVFAKYFKAILWKFGSIILERSWMSSTIIIFIVFHLMRRSVESSYYQVTIRFLICNRYCSFFCLIFSINNSVVSNRKRNWLRTICVIQYLLLYRRYFRLYYL